MEGARADDAGTEKASLELRPILDADAETVAAFLHKHLNTRVPHAAWRALLSPPWRAAAPNSGFQLRAGEQIVGVYAAVYSERDIDRATVRFCNLAAFCVRDEYRAHSLRLLRALLAQKDDVFTDFSPSGNVVALNERLGFVRLDTSTRLSVNLPAMPGRGIRVSGDPAVLEATLAGVDAVAYRDHRNAAAARHLVVSAPGGYAYLVFRRDRRKRLPLFATPLYVGGSRALLRAAWPRVASHLLLRHGLAVTLAEPRILGFAPRLGTALAAPRAKMFRGRTIPPERIDYLYSELTLLEW
ncbi:hypothetical protein NQ152_11810 [Microbacterium sp. zg.B48]|uniref:hypothetical protein n=1 Tax=Microbacterium sp. zg.B48 TaxID=2969408 RepID=UPI00214C715B|nr:hypothetical protein [Microbacterium sp. zg.B48]MCR2764188.1 hypothetical protein [Microbacterium sp. zg.B48]